MDIWIKTTLDCEFHTHGWECHGMELTLSISVVIIMENFYGDYYSSLFTCKAMNIFSERSQFNFMRHQSSQAVQSNTFCNIHNYE